MTDRAGRQAHAGCEAPTARRAMTAPMEDETMDDVLDREAAVDDAAWDRRMAEARRPPPDLVLCGSCEGRALGPDASPCPECYGLGTVEVWRVERRGQSVMAAEVV